MSELLKKPCSCGGNNPNCYMCGGWGYIDSVSESRIPTGQGEVSGRIKQPSQRRKRMSDNEIIERIVSADTKKREKNNKELNKLSSKFPKNIKSVIKKQICNICGKEIIDENEHIICLFAKSNSTEQNISKSKAKKTTNIKIHKIRETKKNCLFCGQSIFKDIIDIHIERKHSNLPLAEQEKIRIALSLLFINLS